MFFVCTTPSERDGRPSLCARTSALSLPCPSYVGSSKPKVKRGTFVGGQGFSSAARGREVEVPPCSRQVLSFACDRLYMRLSRSLFSLASIVANALFFLVQMHASGLEHVCALVVLEGCTRQTPGGTRGPAEGVGYAFAVLRPAGSGIFIFQMANKVSAVCISQKKHVFTYLCSRACPASNTGESRWGLNLGQEEAGVEPNQPHSRDIRVRRTVTFSISRRNHCLS